MDRRASGAKCHSTSSLLSNLKSSKWGKAGGGIATGQGRVHPLKNHLLFKGGSIEDFSCPLGDVSSQRRQEEAAPWMTTGAQMVNSGENSAWSCRTVADHVWTLLSLQTGKRWPTNLTRGSQLCAEGCPEFVKSLQEEPQPADKLQSSPCFSSAWSECGTAAPLLLVTGV